VWISVHPWLKRIVTRQSFDGRPPCGDNAAKASVFKITQLPNGVRVATAEMAHMESVVRQAGRRAGLNPTASSVNMQP